MAMIMNASKVEAADLIMYALQALRYGFAKSVMILPAITV